MAMCQKGDVSVDLWAFEAERILPGLLFLLDQRVVPQLISEQSSILNYKLNDFPAVRLNNKFGFAKGPRFTCSRIICVLLALAIKALADSASHGLGGPFCWH